MRRSFSERLQLINSCSFQLFTCYTSSPKTSIAEASSLAVEVLYIYTCHANGTSQELCGKDVGTETCSISLCLIIPIGPNNSRGFNEVCWGSFGCPRMARTPSAGLRGWCWAACTRHPPSSHGEWIKAAHEDTSARAHCSLQRQAMATKVSPVVRNVFWRWRERFQRWCLMMPVSFMFPDAEECMNTHHARSKNSTSCDCSNFWLTTGQHNASTLGLGRFPTMDQIKSMDAFRNADNAQLSGLTMCAHTIIWVYNPAKQIIYMWDIIVDKMRAWILRYMFNPGTACIQLGNLISSAQFNPSSIPACQEHWNHHHWHESDVHRDDIWQSCDRAIGSWLAD